ncbi:DUF6527 family protein [uncultured Croceitalea sp.]|uniref:DUF6527 family protein n=1 Tax=uncultured Croceitalea sp. TaxID=1798908 RepID=UPI0033058515
MRKLFKKLWEFLFPRKFKIICLEERPQTLTLDTIYIIGDWAICFICPCGCKAYIQLNTIPSTSPKWYYKIKLGKVSIFPSIRRTIGCRSHFWITKGNLYWC